MEAAPHAVKRPIDQMDGGQNFIFGDVQKPMKRSRVGVLSFFFWITCLDLMLFL